MAVGGIALMAINLRKARTIEDTPVAKIRSAARGYVGITGFARALGAELLRAPLAGTPCVWYRYSIERYQRHGRNSSWDTVERGTSEAFFALDDNTGHCHVDPRRAEVKTAMMQRWKGDRGSVTAASGLGFFSRRIFSRDEYRYTEYRIHPDEWIYVLGWYETVHGAGLAERTTAQTKLLLNQWKQNRDALLARFDRNRNGEIDMHEWEHARNEAAQLAQQSVLREPEPAPVNILSAPPLQGRPYLISSKDPRVLAALYRRAAALSLVTGL